jgi:hypothetical protein
MDVCKGIFRVSIDVYPYSCSEAECTCEGNKFSLLCKSSNQQQVGLMTESRVTIAYLANMYCPDKAAAICEIFNVWVAKRLIS